MSYQDQFRGEGAGRLYLCTIATCGSAVRDAQLGPDLVNAASDVVPTQSQLKELAFSMREF